MATNNRCEQQQARGAGSSALPLPQAYDDNGATLSDEEMDVLRAIYADAAGAAADPSSRAYNGGLQRTNYGVF
jgi:hypothetical protein